MKNVFEYWKGRRGLEMWAVLDEGTVEVRFPFDTVQAESLQGRPDFVGTVHHLTRNDGCYIVTVNVQGRQLTAECKSLEAAADRARQLAVPLKLAV